MNTKAISLLICLLLSVCGHAERTSRLLNEGWKFRFSHQVERNTAISVTLPHTWNAHDALSGKPDYKRGIGNYERKLYVAQELKGKRLFLRFEGANSVATLFVNGKYAGEVELWVNGQKIGRKRPDEYKMVVWKDVPMQKGKNHIRVQTVKKPKLSEEMMVNL